MMMGGPGITEILIIALILVFIFGAKRLPGIGEGLGKTVKELRNIKKEAKGEKQAAKKKEIEGSEPLASASQEPSPSQAEASSASGSGVRDTEGGETSDSVSKDASSSEGDLVDAFQKKMTKKVTDRVLGQVPGIKQAKQLKNTADKIKKIVS